MSSTEGVKEIESEDEFKEFISEGKCVLDFYATWCRPCKLISPVFAELSKSYPDIKFGKVNVEKVQDGQVLKVPTFKFYSDGGKELSQSVTGMNPDNLKLCVKKFAEDNLT